MDPIQKLKRVINNRVCCVISKGKSVEELERNIELFRNKKVCWIVQNRFDYIEDILKKIGEKADIISDCATVSRKELFEKEVRYDRFFNFLMRSDLNLLATSELVLEENKEYAGKKDFDLRTTFKNKIVTIDSVFSSPNCPKEVWDKPPNSLTLLLAFLIAGQAKNIILFGIDGARPGQAILDSYYKPDIARAERRLTFGDERTGSVVSDGKDFNERWAKIEAIYKIAFNNPDVKIYNGSSISLIKTFPKINYKKIKELL